MSNAPATFIARSADGMVWIGTASDGVDRVNLQQAQFGFQRRDPLSDNSFLDRPMRALAEDANGIIWAGAAHFLTRFDPATNSFRHFDPPLGPRPLGSPSAVDINRIIPDGNGGVWFDGVNGIAHFDGKTERFQNYRPLYQGTSRLLSRILQPMGMATSGLLPKMIQHSTVLIWRASSSRSFSLQRLKPK